MVQKSIGKPHAGSWTFNGTNVHRSLGGVVDAIPPYTKVSSYQPRRIHATGVF